MRIHLIPLIALATLTTALPMGVENEPRKSWLWGPTHELVENVKTQKSIENGIKAGRYNVQDWGTGFPGHTMGNRAEVYDRNWHRDYLRKKTPVQGFEAVRARVGSMLGMSAPVAKIDGKYHTTQLYQPMAKARENDLIPGGTSSPPMRFIPSTSEGGYGKPPPFFEGADV